MRIYVDLTLEQITIASGIQQALASLTFKRSPFAALEVQFVRNGTVVELASDATGIFEVKTSGQYDSSPLTSALAWTKTGAGEETVYTLVFSLINAPLDAALGVDEPVAFTSDDTTDLLTSAAHGLTAGTVLQFPVSDTFTPNTNYYVIASGLTADDFKVSTTVGGTAFDVTDAESGSWRRVTPDIVAKTLMAELQWTSAGQVHKTQTVDFILVNDVVRDGDVPPSSPALMYGIFLPEIETLAEFKDVPTIGRALGSIVGILIDVLGTRTLLWYILKGGPAVDPEPAHAEPNDYDLGTNDVHWEGAAGPSGPAGVSAGLPYKWNTDTTSTDPASGKVKVNHATLASATALYLSETDQEGNALGPLFATWDDGTSPVRGRLFVLDPAAPTNFAIFDITGTRTDNGAWDTFSITPVTSGGTLTNNLPVQLSFLPEGNKGDQGDPGFKYLFNSATAADPGTGKFLFNHATFLSATQLLISETDGNANGLAALLATLDDSTSANKCLAVCQKASGAGYFAFYITGTITDNGTYDTFSITPISSGGSIANNDIFFVSFARVGDAGATGSPGSAGATGTAGRSAALQYLFNTSTSNADPGAGKLKLNNATLAGATALYISETDNETNVLSALLATWDDSTSTIKGRLFLNCPATPTIFAIYDISGTITDNGTWDTFTIAHVASGGTFTNNLAITALFVPTGNVGATGGTTYDAAVAIGAGTTPTVDLSAVSMSTLRTLTGNTTVTLSNPVNGKVTILHFKQAAASSYTLAFPDVDYWVGTGGVTPAMSTTFDLVDAVTIWYDGTFYYGSWAPG